MMVIEESPSGHSHSSSFKAPMKRALSSGRVWTHSVVIGELAAGRLARRTEILAHLQRLPRVDEIDLAEGLHLLDQHDLAGRGLSWSDVQLLAAAHLDHLTIWTRDRALARATTELGLAAAG